MMHISRFPAVSGVLAIVLSAMFLSTSAHAQRDTNGDGFTDVLVPIVVNGLEGSMPGAYGSEWRAELWLNNASAFDLGAIKRGVNCPIPFSCSPLYPRKHTVLVSETDGDMNRGAVFAIATEVAQELTLSARLLELSRRAQPNGIELPIVWEESYLTRPVRLIGIPQQPDARVAVRLYAPRQSDVSVRVEAITTGGQVIGTAFLNAAVDLTANADRPGYAAITDLSSVFPLLSSHDRFDIRITPLTADVEYYAFASVTDRDTQHVLLVTPDR